MVGAKGGSSSCRKPEKALWGLGQARLGANIA